MDLRDKTGLLIDDLPEMRSAVRIQLADGGLEKCDAARNVKEAIDKIAVNRYDVLSRIWADSWRSATGMPLHASEAQGVASLQAEAARLGANGLVNVVCLDQGRPNWWSSPAPAYLCYGIAVRVKANAG